MIRGVRGAVLALVIRQENASLSPLVCHLFTHYIPAIAYVPFAWSTARQRSSKDLLNEPEIENPIVPTAGNTVGTVIGSYCKGNANVVKS